MWAKPPLRVELMRVMAIYDGLGFTNAMASADVTYVHWGCAPALHRKTGRSRP